MVFGIKHAENYSVFFTVWFVGVAHLEAGFKCFPTVVPSKLHMDFILIAFMIDESFIPEIEFELSILV